jgi:hypothetical protein
MRSTTALTLRAVPALMHGSPRNTRETVLAATPAARATLSMEGVEIDFLGDMGSVYVIFVHSLTVQ